MKFNLRTISGALISLYLVFCVSLLYWVVIYSGSGDGDTLEHVHTSWLVWQGKIPYKDFFQHHNPLLWYVGAPFVGYYEYSLRAVDAVNMVTVTVFALTLFFIYRLHKDFLTATPYFLRYFSCLPYFHTLSVNSHYFHVCVLLFLI